MNQIIKLASRNIWRNKRRTLITAAAIMFAVFFAIAMNSIQTGIWDNMEKGMVNSYMGYAQIHSNGYWEDQTLDYAFQVDEDLEAIPSKYKDIKALVPRIESFALASTGMTSKGVVVVGIDPDKEDALTGVSQKVAEGEFLKMEDTTVLIASGLAEYLDKSIGDTLILVSSGYQGATAAGAYLISGILKFPSPELDNQMVYMSLPLAQEFYASYDMISTLVVNTSNPNIIKSTVENLKNDLGETYEVMDYEELMPDLIQARELDTAGNVFMQIILYTIITFGIFGTILMMVKERNYEFGVLTSIGMKRWKLGLMVWLETVFIGLIGTFAGLLLASPIVYWFYANPYQLEGEMATAYEDFGIEPLIVSSTDPMIFINQGIWVFVIVTILAVYPFRKILRLKPVEAMRT
jgi:ABC-type lipoprotein release transport system permease subunit